MKKTTRLSAVVLMLALCMNLFVSALATTEGIPIEDLDVSTYQRLLADSEYDDPWNLTGECGDDNIYCQHVKYLLEELSTAQERYDYMVELYNDTEDTVALEFTMAHYFGTEEHANTNLLCVCNFPSYEPDYVVGDISLHDEACPWHFANLQVAEQYDVICFMAVPARMAYYNTLDEDQYAALFEYMESIGVSEECDGEACGYNEFAALSGFERDDKLAAMYEVYEEGHVMDMYNTFISHIITHHTETNKVCNCSPYYPDKHFYGALDHVGVSFGDGGLDYCPWHFKYLTAAEQYQVVKNLTDEEKAKYYASISDVQIEALNEYIGAINATEGNAGDSIASVNITIPEGTFSGDYYMNASKHAPTESHKEAVKLNGNYNVISVFDISFDDLENPGAELQPIDGKAVELSFKVATSEVSGDKLHVFHINDDGTAEKVGNPVIVDRSLDYQTITVEATSFSSWITSDSCDGSACDNNGGTEFSYNELAKLDSAEARYEYLDALYGESAEEINLETFMLHLSIYHPEIFAAICCCAEFPLPAPGSSGHIEPDCVWHPNNYEGITYDWWDGFATTVSLKYYHADAVSYQWYSSADGVTWNAINGAVEGECTLNVTVETMMCEYRCAAFDANGNELAISSDIRLVPSVIIDWLRSKPAVITDEVMYMAKQDTDDGIALDQAIGITESNELVWLYEVETLATIDEDGNLIDSRYHIPVAKVVDGVIYPIEDAAN